jgi:hypothetical protein
MSIERNSLLSDRNACDVRADLDVEAISIHPEVAGRVSHPKKTRFKVGHDPGVS